MGKHRIMMKDSNIARHLPQTLIATAANVRTLLKLHSVVYLKPNHGTGGNGIFKLSTHDKSFGLQSGVKSQTFISFDGAFKAFKKSAGKKVYIVQKGIPLLRYRNRPFDLRIMVQRNPNRKWEVTGMIGRLAQPKKIVTNYHNGGRPLPVRQLLTPTLSPVAQNAYIQRLNQLGLRTSGHVNKFFPRFRSYGLDIGIDKELKIWIIEVNTRPDKTIFNVLKDKRMFRKIVRYAKIANDKKA
ncbi:YheC/YheD family protein [Cohnella endophytica]|uniref:YheC/YheD family protein n=2 Tax=Cohnella endophytica TaxID=2419778 RepID=A0A494YCX7_9BACL|nr:YheC/YheD family protein [Cohnella endophytica]